MDHSEWAAVIELDRKKPFAFPELGVSIVCQKTGDKDRVRVILGKIENVTARKPRKGLTSRRRKE